MATGTTAAADGDLAVLARVPFFARLTSDQLAELRGSRRHVEAGEIVFAEGDDSDGMYVVLSGAVRIFHEATEADDDFVLGTMGAGEFFGETALLEGAQRSANVAATEPSDLLFVGREDLERLLASADGRVALDVVAAMSRLLRERGDSVWRQELARRELETQAELERHRALSQLVAGVAHELGTPLGIANTAAGIIESRVSSLREGADASAAAERAIGDVLEGSALLRSSLERAHRLVQSFKKVSVQQTADRLETVDIVATVQDVVELYRIEGKRAGMAIEVISEVDGGGSRWTGYPGRLGQVLLNLLTNAERYAYPSGGGLVEVVIAASAGPGDGFAVTVRDHGQGIPESDLERIFEPFFTTGRSRGGTGLGLAIVHNLVTAGLGGSIGVDSEVGVGTAVTVTVPNLEGAP